MHADRSPQSPAATGTSSLRQELVRALGLGEILLLAALVVLAPVLRLEDSYVPVTGALTATGLLKGFQPHDIVGEGYFLWLVAILGLLVAARIAAAGRAALPEPATAAALAGWTLFVALRGAAGDHPFEGGNFARMWLGHLALFVIVLAASAGKGGARRFLFAAVVAGLVLESVQTVWQARVTLPAIHDEVRAGVPMPELNMDSPVALSRVMSGEPMNGFLSPNLLAAWLGMAALAGAGLFAGCMAAARVNREGGRLGGLTVVAAAALPPAAVFAWAFELTGSKGAWLAALGAVAGTLLVAAPGGSERSRRTVRLAAAAALALAFAAGAAYRFAPNLPGRAGLSASVEVRAGYWSAAATMVDEHRAFGSGPGTFGAHFPRLKGPMAEESQSAHCAWLETAAESGLVGLALLAGFWALVLWRLWRRPVADASADPAPETNRPREQALVVLLVGMGATAAFGWLKFGEDDVGQFMTALQFGTPFMEKALAFATIRALDFPLIWSAVFALAAWPVLRRGNGRAATAPAAERWLILGAAAAVATFAIHASVDMDMNTKALAGSALILAALALAGPGCRELRLEGRRSAALGAAVALLAATTLWLGAREYGRGGAIAGLCEPPPKEAAPLERAAWLAGRYENAISADPSNYYLRVRLAQALNVARHTATDRELAAALRRQCEEELCRAVALAPARITPRRVLGHWLLLEGRYAEAAGAFAGARALYPFKAEICLEWGDAELLAGRPDAARGLYRDALDTSRRVSDEAIHLSVLFEAPAQMAWETPRLAELAGALDRLIAERPGDGALLLRRALVEVTAARPEPALERLRRASAAEPHDALLALFVGYGLRLAGEHEKALEKMAEAGKLEKSPGALPAGPRAVTAAINRTRDAIALGLARPRERRTSDGK